MDIDRKTSEAKPIEAATRRDLEARILEALSQMSTEEIRRLIQEMEANLSSS